MRCCPWNRIVPLAWFFCPCLLALPLLVSTATAAVVCAPIDELGRASTLEEVYSLLGSRRAEQIQHLREYAAAGVYPKNTDFPGRYVPYFKDLAGTHCAVAHLMHLDGLDDVIGIVSASDNHVRIKDIQVGPVADWMRTSGLTQAECARIQPTYWHMAQPVPVMDHPRDPRAVFDEIEQARLDAHFDTVIRELMSTREESIRAAFTTWITRTMSSGAEHSALQARKLVESLDSANPDVQRAALYALAHPDGPMLGELEWPSSAHIVKRKYGRARFHFMDDWVLPLRRRLTDDSQDIRFIAALAWLRQADHGQVFVDNFVLLDALNAREPLVREVAVVQIGSAAPRLAELQKWFHYGIMPKFFLAAMRWAALDPEPDVAFAAQEIIATRNWQAWSMRTWQSIQWQWWASQIRPHFPRVAYDR